MRLFVDDTRKFPTNGYNCCRDAATAKVLLAVLKIRHLSLDYDLGHNCETGLDILKWMKEQDIHVPEINIHSNHVIGVKKMYQYCLENFPDSVVTARMLKK